MQFGNKGDLVEGLFSRKWNLYSGFIWDGSKIIYNGKKNQELDDLYVLESKLNAYGLELGQPYLSIYEKMRNAGEN